MKLNAFYLGMPWLWLPPKLLLIMRLVIIILIASLMQVFAVGFAQRVTLNEKNASLESVISKIRNQTGYDFVFDFRLLEKARKVSVNLKNADLDEALQTVFKNQVLDYTIKDKIIVIDEKKKGVVDRIISFIKAIRVTGTVTDEKGKPLSGVSIRLKGTTTVVISASDGGFSIEVPDNNAVLQFSYIGYESKEVKASNNLRITLEQSNSKLDEVQVIAYGTTTRRLSTSSISTVKAVDIENQPVTNPMAALQGRVPGLVVTQTSGVAGSTFKIQIRGQGSLDLTLSKNDPLFVIDGVPFEPGNSISGQVTSAAKNPTNSSTGGLSPLNSINPQDIESIDVLKDADATSIYGSRGANGVILITTKKGIAGTTKFNVNVNTGINVVGRIFPLLNTEQYLMIRREAYANDGLTPSSNPADPGFAPDITLWDNNRYTDFQKLFIGSTGHTTNVQGTVSGGNELTQFRIGGNYHGETSAFASKFSDNIASASMSLNHSSRDKRFSIQFSGIYSSDKNKLPNTDLTRYLNLPPNMRLYDESGNLSWDEGGITHNSLNTTNPLAILNTDYQSLNENLSANFNLSFLIVKGLSVKSNMGYNSYSSNETGLSPKASISPYVSTLPSSSFASAKSRNWIIEPQLEYKFSEKSHSLNAIAGATFQNRDVMSSTQSGSNYTSDLLLNSIAAAGTISARNDESKYRYTAIFGRLNYNYKDKYIATLSARRDGSSRFGPDKQFANFGAIGVAWLFSNETFVKDFAPFLTYGKLRSSYGTTGNDQIGEYKFLNLWRNSAQTYIGIPGLIPSSVFNPDYNWEINKKFEIAFEVGVFKDNLLASIAYYNNRCDNQLIRYTLPGQTGFFDVVKNFPGLVQNSGWELTLNSKNIQNDHLKWTTAFNISIPRNKLISFPGLSSSSYKNKYVVGKSLSIIRAYKYLGMDTEKGIYTFLDLNGDGYAFEEEQYFGNMDPKFTGGIQNNFSYKNIDLGFFFQFTKQTGINYLGRLAGSRPGGFGNQPTLLLGRWTTPGQQAEIQRVSALSQSEVSIMASYFAGSDAAYSDASFIKLKNVSLGYRFPEKWLNRLRLSGLRFYGEAQNLWTITGYKGSDPEIQDLFVLPPLRTFVFGAQLTF